ncbi:DUF3718 domain-containing protein [Pseudoalteromonas sp.]|uniref:DUF3718 domain-containing protein n=1 Tax=Pseudoalteromonas sp. TaxID=53249 RepID=UPI0035691551
MKVIAAALVSATLLASANASADTQFVALDNSPGTELCIAFASNKPLELKKALNNNRVKKFQIDDKLTCNDMTLAQFATVYGLNRTSNFMNLDVSTSTSIKDLAMAKKELVYISGSK